MIIRSPKLRNCLFEAILCTGVVLSGDAAMAQLSGTPSRYDVPVSAGAPASSGVGNVGGTPAPGGSQAPAGRSPFGAAAPSTTNGAGGNTSLSPGATRNSPFGQGTADNGGASRKLPLSGTNPQSTVGSNPPPAAAPNFQSAPQTGSQTSTQTGAGLTPSAMMRAMLSPPAGSRLRGRLTSLQDVVTGAQNRGDQTARVEAYWDLCSSVADYYLGLREAEELRRLRSFVQQAGATWSQAESDLNIRVGTSQRAATASQLRLASLMGRSPGDLPIPADAPHCASYDTQFEQIFASGAPAEARELAAVLPARYVELKVAAAAVSRGEQLVEDVARRDSDGTVTLRTLELLALQRRAFVQIARDYNRRIARYSELASPGQISPVRLTSMLIYTSASANAIPVYSAPPRIRQSNTSPSPPRTFVGQSSPALMPIADVPPETGGVLPASAEQSPPELPAETGEEKSLLVAPLKQ